MPVRFSMLCKPIRKHLFSLVCRFVQTFEKLLFVHLKKKLNHVLILFNCFCNLLNCVRTFFFVALDVRIMFVFDVSERFDCFTSCPVFLHLFLHSCFFFYIFHSSFHMFHMFFKHEHLVELRFSLTLQIFVCCLARSCSCSCSHHRH